MSKNSRSNDSGMGCLVMLGIGCNCNAIGGFISRVCRRKQ